MKQNIQEVQQKCKKYKWKDSNVQGATYQVDENAEQAICENTLRCCNLREQSEH